jgi:acyl CoA:acetate/3-ketoacid CoA transferase alpha subunit
MQEIYILNQMVYNNCEETYSEIIGAFENYRTAENKMRELIKENVKDFNFVIDNECDMKIFDLNEIQTRLFFYNQENWDNYIEIKINRVILK